MTNVVFRRWFDDPTQQCVASSSAKYTRTWQTPNTWCIHMLSGHVWYYSVRAKRISERVRAAVDSHGWHMLSDRHSLAHAISLSCMAAIVDEWGKLCRCVCVPMKSKPVRRSLHAKAISYRLHCWLYMCQRVAREPWISCFCLPSSQSINQSDSTVCQDRSCALCSEVRSIAKQNNRFQRRINDK